jgi:phosphoribosylformimino-5-aminoimidazole carboxamide ribotide isomerase
MYIIPSIDLQDGRCVKLVEGKVGSGFVVSNDPLELAKFWEVKGADMLHVVDLDGAIKGERKNRGLVEAILREVSIPVEVGGGLRTVDDVLDVLDAGARWAVIGTKIVEKKDFIDDLLRNIDASKLIVAIDVKGGKVVARGWTMTSDLSPIDLIKRVEKYNVFAFLLTNVDVEGREAGVNLSMVKSIVSATRIPIIYSGGVANVSELIELRRAGAYGVIVGSALYKGKFTLKEAKDAVEGA